MLTIKTTVDKELSANYDFIEVEYIEVVDGDIVIKRFRRGVLTKSGQISRKFNRDYTAIKKAKIYIEAMQ